MKSKYYLIFSILLVVLCVYIFLIKVHTQKKDAKYIEVQSPIVNFDTTKYYKATGVKGYRNFHISFAETNNRGTCGLDINGHLELIQIKDGDKEEWITGSKSTVFLISRQLGFVGLATINPMSLKDMKGNFFSIVEIKTYINDDNNKIEAQIDYKEGKYKLIMSPCSTKSFFFRNVVVLSLVCVSK